MQEFKGQLAGFPPEVVEKMLERQVEQGNPRDVSVFEITFYANRRNKGFDWSLTKEGLHFWNKVIIDKKFNEFFEEYPKHKIVFEPETGYHAETIEEAVMLLEEADKQGYRWGSEKSFKDNYKWNLYGKNTYYLITSGCYGSVKYPHKCKIVKVSDLFNLKPKTQTNDETNRPIEANRNSERGEICRISGSKRQITTGIRPIGNKTAIRFKTAKLVETKRSSNIISI